MLTCALKAHVAASKHSNLTFNDVWYLILRKLNTQFLREYLYIYLLYMCPYGRAHVNIFQIYKSIK
jgi:hypothetical protein